MKKTGFKITIINDKFGTLLDEVFVDEIQFKLFLKMVHGCVELKEDLTFFDGNTFYIHIPSKQLLDCIIVTSTTEIDMVKQVKSKIEALVTK
jgi:hypothetical protein